jgi:hypothetical protein
MRVRLIFLLLAVPLLLLAACAPPPELRNDALLKDESLITGEPCGAPCFRGITPGETSWNEALTIVEDDAQFTNVQTQQAEDSDLIQAAWQDGDGQLCCQMISEDGETISGIFLLTAPTMNVADVIRVHGEPTYITGTEFTEDQAVVNLFYPDVPMIVYAFIAGIENGVLSESSEIVGSVYLTADQMDLFLQTLNLYRWDGYKAYSEYATDAFDVTPSVTLTPTPAQ